MCAYIYTDCAQSLSRGQLFKTPWTIARQVPLSMECPRQEYWSGLPFPSPGIFTTQGRNLSPESLALAGRFSTTEPPGKSKSSHEEKKNFFLPL